MISICEWDKKCKQRFAYTMWWILRALWLVVAHDLLEYRHLDDVTGNAFPFFVENGARFWECLRDYLVLIRIRQVKSAKNVEHELLTEKKNENAETKRVLDDLKLIGRCLYGNHMDEVTGTCFICFIHGGRFWKCLRDYYGLKQIKTSKKN